MRAFSIFRSVAFAALSGIFMLTAQALLPDRAGISAAQAQPAELGDFHLALEPYGMWQIDRRWGEVWVPFDRPAGWRPYSIGHWVYTDEWGWYWISELDEEDWGWITYHYGRWARNAQFGWFWIPGDEWAPAWVNWRDSDDAVGWAPLPPDNVIGIYDDDPVYWTFIAPRYLFLPAPYRHYYAVNRRPFFMRRSILVNRSLSAGGGRRFGVNPGIPPGRIAAVNRAAVPTFRVQPRVLAGTQGVAGAVQIQRSQLNAGRPAAGQQGGQRGQRRASGVNAVAVQPTNTSVAPAANVQPLQPLGKGERGRLGSQPPRAVQGGAAPAAAPNAPAVAPSAAPAAAPKAPAVPPSATPAPAPKAPAVSPPAAPAVAPPSTSPPANAPPPRQELRRNPPQPGAGNPPPPSQPVAPAPQIKQAAPPAVQTRPPPPPVARPAPPTVVRPPPPAVARPAPPPVAHPPPPAVARPAPPPAARPAPPPVARPAAPPPRPATPPPPAAKKPPPKPGEQEQPK